MVACFPPLNLSIGVAGTIWDCWDFSATVCSKVELCGSWALQGLGDTEVRGWIWQNVIFVAFRSVRELDSIPSTEHSGAPWSPMGPAISHHHAQGPVRAGLRHRTWSSDFLRCRKWALLLCSPKKNQRWRTQNFFALWPESWKLPKL